MQGEIRYSNETRYSSETIKKASMEAEDGFDYLKLTAKVQGLLPCTYEESLEEVTFTYDISGKQVVREIKEAPEDERLRFLINFYEIGKLFLQYRLTLDEDHIFFDRNLMPCIRRRDLYGREQEPDEKEFLYCYRCIAGGVLSKKYSVSNVLESGPEILRKEKKLEALLQADTPEALVSSLERRREETLKIRKEKFREVGKRRYAVWRILGVTSMILCAAAAGAAVYYGAFVTPGERALVMANERFITKDYVGCIDSAARIEPEDMDVCTKYILAYSYASTENFKKEEIGSIIDRLSVNGNERELEYWIHLGRLELRQAENIALSLSDDRLLIYAYMKEIDVLENDSSMDGEEKKNRLDTLNREVIDLGKKYQPEE